MPDKLFSSADSGRLTADGWVYQRFPRRGGRRAPVASAAAADGVLFLNGQGALHRINDDGQQVAPVWGPLAGGDAFRMIVDAVTDRVLVIEVRQRRTWAHHNGTWTRLGDPPSVSDRSLMCATPRGVYLLNKRDLWLLDGVEWKPVGRAEPGWRATLLWWSPARDGLWLLGRNGIEVWSDDGPQPVPSAPPPPWSWSTDFECDGAADLVTAGYDPVSDALLWYMQGTPWWSDSGRSMKPTPVEERTWMLRLADCALPQATLPEPSPDPLPDLPVQSPPALSFYVVESSIALPGAEESDSFRERVGFVHVTIDRDEVRRLVTEEVKRFRDEYADVDLEPTIGVWTVQVGVLTSFLDLTDASPVDRPAVSARLPALLAPVAEVDYDDLLDVRVPDPHPAPDIETWLGCDQDLLYGENVL